MFLSGGINQKGTLDSGPEGDNIQISDKIKLINFSLEKNNYSEGEYIEVNGTIKNIAEELLNIVDITIYYYNNESIWLFSDLTSVDNLLANSSANFTFTHYDWDLYYYDIHHVNFTFAIE